MLRTYKPITHPIFGLHARLEHLVCLVWCNASDENTCEQLIEDVFDPVYREYAWLKLAIDTIYEKCKLLSAEERAAIREAFNINNRIEELCEGKLAPIPLSSLSKVVEDDMKPLLVRFYNELLDRALVEGDKLDYYNCLINRNKYTTCPCCGLSIIETAESHYVEDNDHYLPKAEYPFAIVNFLNLVPLCSKCNKKCKGVKNPFDKGRISFYPFDGDRANVDFVISISDNEMLDYGDLKAHEVDIMFDDNVDKLDTWDWLFNIKDRYNEQIRSLSKTELRTMANRLYRNKAKKTGLSYEAILNETIVDYNEEIYEDRKFLKVAFLTEIKTKPEWMAVYREP